VWLEIDLKKLMLVHLNRLRHGPYPGTAFDL
jgi:hypothetical protein